MNYTEALHQPLSEDVKFHTNRYMHYSDYVPNPTVVPETLLKLAERYSTGGTPGLVSVADFDYLPGGVNHLGIRQFNLYRLIFGDWTTGAAQPICTADLEAAISNPTASLKNSIVNEWIENRKRFIIVNVLLEVEYILNEEEKLRSELEVLIRNNDKLLYRYYECKCSQTNSKS